MSRHHRDVHVLTHSSPTRRSSDLVGTSVVVENVRGAGCANAMAKLATAPADGSIFYGTTPTFINTSLLSSPDYTYKDLAPAVNVFLDPQIVYVRADRDRKSTRLNSSH